MEHFKNLNAVNVNDHTEQKDGLTYLSWAWAWAEVKNAYPDATYTIKRFDGKPYLFDEQLGYMVFTEMTIENHTHEMWLPVMNGAKKSMKNVPYTYDVKKFEWDNAKRKNVWNGNYEQKTVEAATMFDINTAIMRCLTKNIAMFGLGLYIYAGEDLPEGEIVEKEHQPQPQTKADNKPKAPNKDFNPPKSLAEELETARWGKGKHAGELIKDTDIRLLQWYVDNGPDKHRVELCKLAIKEREFEESLKAVETPEEGLPWYWE